MPMSSFPVACAVKRSFGEAARSFEWRAHLSHLAHRQGLHPEDRQHQRTVAAQAHTDTHTHTQIWCFGASLTFVWLFFFSTAWVQKIKAASEEFIDTEKKKREKAYQGSPLHWFHTDANKVIMSLINACVCVFAARSMKASGIGRLLVTILEATELKAAKTNGELKLVLLLHEYRCSYIVRKCAGFK